MDREATLKEASVMGVVLFRLIQEIYSNGGGDRLEQEEMKKIRKLSWELANELNWAVYNDRARSEDESK